jgi:hypothetical protein
MGIIEFLDPATLKTISSITVSVRSNGTGLNGISADPDGHTIYIEGPAGSGSPGANGCCWLYSIDLGTLRTNVVADVWGTASRSAFVHVGASLLQRISTTAANLLSKPPGDRWYASPDGHWWFGLRNGPALDLYDAAQGQITHSFTATGRNDNWYSEGTWLANRFYIYSEDDHSGRLWSLSPESTQLGEGIPVPPLDQVSQCSGDSFWELTAAAGRLVLYEVFGGKLDRRDRCDDVPGGAWMVDPASGRLEMHVVPDLHFWELIPNHDGSELYGITSDLAGTQAPGELVRIDARRGKVLQRRVLDSDYWWIAAAPFRELPPRNVSVTLPLEDAR